MERIPLGEKNKVIVRAAGDVCIRGWEQPEMQALGDSERQVHTSLENGAVYVVAKGDLCLSVPAGAEVRVEHISGDGYFCGLSGKLDVQKVAGDLAVEECAGLEMAVVGGDLLLRNLGGTVSIQKVSGDLNGEALAGGLVVEQVGGSASFQAGAGPLRLRVGGDLKLYLPGAGGAVEAGGEGADEVNLKAGGDIEMYVDPEIGARLELSSGGHEIEIETQHYQAQVDESNCNCVLGDGKRLMRFRAGGDIRVTDEIWDEEDLEDQFEELRQEWEEWRGEIEGEEEEEEVRRASEYEARARRRAEQTAQRAEERVRAAMERVERQSRRRQDVFSRFGIRWGNFWPNVPNIPPIPPIPPIPKIDIQIPPIPPIPAIHFGPLQGDEAAGETAPPPADIVPASAAVESGGVSNEERMQVLKMLREHKITIEEADELLRALNGE